MIKQRMLLHMIVASLIRRKSRVLIAFAAILIGITMISGTANVYYDIGQKMSRELRTYGANLRLAPSSPEKMSYINLKDISIIAEGTDKANLVGYMPYLYGIARIKSYQIVVVGTRFDQIGKVSPYWKIAGGTAKSDWEKGSALIGQALSKKLGIKPGDKVELSSLYASKARPLLVYGILISGSTEENQVFVNHAFAEEFFDRRGLTNMAYFSIMGSFRDLEGLSRSIQASFSGISASPIKRISQSEGQVLVKIKSLVFLATSLILLLTFLCVAITMMNMTMERRQEIGLRKALGAHEKDIIFEFVAEGSALGLTGGLMGWALGLIVAQIIGWSVFHSLVSPRPEVLPFVVLFSVVMAGLASYFPARAAARIQPAMTLRGE